MQSTDYTNVQQQAEATPQAACVRELSVQELLLVSGGSPRGGWLEPTPSAAPMLDFTSSPRGGW